MKVIYYPGVEKKIRSLPKPDESRVIKTIDLFLDYKFLLTEAYLKKIVKEIWELRAGRYRLLFGITRGNIIVVNMFMKKTQKTPKHSIELALRRLKKYEK